MLVISMVVVNAEMSIFVRYYLGPIYRQNRFHKK